MPVKIVDLAKKMIKLYGLIPDVDIKIVYSGLRPGEKLYEELLSDSENTLKTYNEKILIAKVRKFDFHNIETMFNQFETLAKDSKNENDLVLLMKSIIPEYISENSVFERLDI